MLRGPGGWIGGGIGRGRMIARESFWFVGEGFDGLRVFCRGHFGDFFELPGEVVDGGVAEAFCDVCEIQLVVADQFAGCIDFHSQEKVDDAAVVLFLEQLLKL